MKWPWRNPAILITLLSAALISSSALTDMESSISLKHGKEALELERRGGDYLRLSEMKSFDEPGAAVEESAMADSEVEEGEELVGSVTEPEVESFDLSQILSSSNQGGDESTESEADDEEVDLSDTSDSVLVVPDAEAVSVMYNPVKIKEREEDEVNAEEDDDEDDDDDDDEEDDDADEERDDKAMANRVLEKYGKVERIVRKVGKHGKRSHKYVSGKWVADSVADSDESEDEHSEKRSHHGHKDHGKHHSHKDHASHHDHEDHDNHHGHKDHESHHDHKEHAKQHRDGVRGSRKQDIFANTAHKDVKIPHLVKTWVSKFLGN